MISDSSIPCKGFGKVLYKATQHVGKAKIAVEVREEEGTEDIGRCCRGEDSGQRCRFSRKL